jgi:hypothetical protein
VVGVFALETIVSGVAKVLETRPETNEGPTGEPSPVAVLAVAVELVLVVVVRPKLNPRPPKPNPPKPNVKNPPPEGLKGAEATV